MAHAAYNAKNFIDAIPNSGGIVSTIARRVGCDWRTAKKYIDELPTVNQAYQNECERVLDIAESTIIDAMIQDKDVQTAKWYAMQKGRGRGYGEQRTVANIDLANLSDSQLERLAKGDDLYAVLADSGSGGA